MAVGTSSEENMNKALWVVQVILAITFLGQGIMKFVQPAGLPEQLAWVYDFTGPLAWLVGIAELAAAAGLILPGLTGIRPMLTPLAALGLVPIMLGAVVFHISRGGELPSVVINVVLLVLAGLVAYGRWFVAPLPEKAR